MGGKLLGWSTKCAVEVDPYARKILLSRQKDGVLEPFPIWDDIRTFDGKPWRGSIDIVTGGFPCQDISAAGKGKGIEAERSGLWVEMARIIREVRPRYALVENSPRLASRGLGSVLGNLAEMGYNAQWGVLGAHHVGAPHKRDRIWIVATDTNSKSKRFEQQRKTRRRKHFQNCRKTISECNGSEECLANTDSQRELQQKGIRLQIGRRSSCGSSKKRDKWPIEPNVGRVAHGVPSRMDRLKTLGNGQVPRVVKLAWSLLSDQG